MELKAQYRKPMAHKDKKETARKESPKCQHKVLTYSPSAKYHFTMSMYQNITLNSLNIILANNYSTIKLKKPL